MTKVFSVLILSIMLIQLVFLPARVAADVCSAVTLTTMPATEITATTAVLNGNMCLAIPPGFDPIRDRDCLGSLVFEYGTAHGIYTSQISANVVSATTANNQLCHNVRGLLQGLTPCTTYYARIVYVLPSSAGVFGDFGNGAGKGLDSAQSLKSVIMLAFPVECPVVYQVEEISFTTVGCPTFIGTGPTSHQSGGFNGTTTTPTTNLSNIVVQSATITSTKASPGEKVEVTANVINKGNSNGTSKINLYIDGQVAESKGITLTSGESTQVHFSVSQNDPGTYSVYVNGVPAGNITVDLFTNNDALIYSVIALFAIGIIGVLYLVVKKRAV